MGSGDWEFREGDKKRVVVIGAGVAGMTAAHELVERGYEVEVVEKVSSPYFKEDGPDIGGMARTSWATVPQPADQFPLEDRDEPFTMLAPDPGPLALLVDKSKLLREGFHFAWTCATQHRPLAVTVFGGRGEVPELETMLASLQRDHDLKFSWTYAAPTVNSSSSAASPVSSPEPPLKVQFAVQSARVPGEHGFRFFPSFYRHMFDTMKRIPISEASIAGTALTGVEPRSDSSRSVFDALRSADDLELGLLPRHGHPRSFKIERHPLRSVEQIRELLANTLEIAGYRGADLYRLATRYLEYLSSSKERRRFEYENTSWSKFLGLDSEFSRYFASHVNSGAQALVAMSSEKNDARTVGSVALQLTLDQIRPNAGAYTDATLRGPTSTALFAPWRAYLESQRVKFTCARLVGFTGNGMAVRPVFAVKRNERYGAVDLAPADYYVITIPVDQFQALFHEDGEPAIKLAPKDAPTLLTRHELEEANALCIELDVLEQRLTHIPPADRNDLHKQLTFPVNDFAANPDEGPFRYMCGIQFYFDADVKVFFGHSVGLDSAWGVSYISQEQYWQNRDRGQAGARGVLSAIFTRFEVPANGRPGTPTGSDAKTAQQCTDDEIAERVWQQIAETWDERANGPLPEPRYYFLDANLKRVGNVWKNQTPYLVNHVGQWNQRGGARTLDGDYVYPVQLGHTVFAGAFMRTNTRLNTMEAANESGRRAANALLDYDGARCQRAPIYDLEDAEVPELAAARDLDARIHKRGGTHVLRHSSVEVALRATPWDLVRLVLPTNKERR